MHVTVKNFVSQPLSETKWTNEQHPDLLIRAEQNLTCCISKVN